MIAINISDLLSFSRYLSLNKDMDGIHTSQPSSCVDFYVFFIEEMS